MTRFVIYLTAAACRIPRVRRHVEPHGLRYAVAARDFQTRARVAARHERTAGRWHVPCKLTRPTREHARGFAVAKPKGASKWSPCASATWPPSCNRRT